MILLLLLACTGEPAEETGGETGCTTPTTWQNFGDGFFRSYCRACHSGSTPERYGAPEGLDFDTEEQVRALEGAIRRATLEDATMPPGGGLLQDDLLLLDEWLRCGE